MGYRHKLFAARGFGVLGAFGIATALQASAQAAGGAILQPVQSVLQDVRRQMV
jgi:hypothetical protein